MTNLPHTTAVGPKKKSEPVEAYALIAQLVNEGLSNRERQLCQMFLETNTNKELADKLFITQKTVKFHLTSIFKKLELTNRMELFKFLIDWEH